MNKRTALVLGACLSLVSLGVSAQTVVDGDVEASGGGYVSTGGNVLKTGLGECLQSGLLNDDNVINKCAGIEDEAVEVADIASDAADLAEEVVVEEVVVEPEPVQSAQIDTREFNETTLFTTGSATLTDAGRTVMGNLFNSLAEYKGITGMSVTGHTDSTGSEALNQALSEQRAATVAAEISTRYPDARIDVVGMGESSPIASNDTEQGRQQNRRVEIEVTATRMMFN